MVELELRVGEDEARDSARGRESVHAQGDVANPLEELAAHQLGGGGVGERLVVPDSALVVAVKMGSGRRSACRRPDGIARP